MTCDDDDMSEMNELLTDSEIDGILDGIQPSGDGTLDAALDALRGLSTGAVPPPSVQLRRLMESGLAAVPAGSGRARRGGRRVSGSAGLAGILLVSATAAAAAIGVHHVTSPSQDGPFGPARPAVTRTSPGQVVVPAPLVPGAGNPWTSPAPTDEGTRGPDDADRTPSGSPSDASGQDDTSDDNGRTATTPRSTLRVTSTGDPEVGNSDDQGGATPPATPPATPSATPTATPTDDELGSGGNGSHGGSSGSRTGGDG